MRVLEHQNSFNAGELSPRLAGRGDLPAYQSGAALLKLLDGPPLGPYWTAEVFAAGTWLGHR